MAKKEERVSIPLRTLKQLLKAAGYTMRKTKNGCLVFVRKDVAKKKAAALVEDLFATKS